MRRGSSALWFDLGLGRFQGDRSAGNLKATRRPARRFARTGIPCPEAKKIATATNSLDLTGAGNGDKATQ